MKTTTKTSKAIATKRAATWAAIWTDARYLRIQARKDAALRAESHALGKPSQVEALKRATATRKRACRALDRFEALFFAAAGIKL